jgi:hypothetical protein
MNELNGEMNGEDSLREINKDLIDCLKAACENNAETITAKFSCPVGLNILTSEDGRFRIYNWDVGQAGAAASFNTLAQYRSKNGVKTLIINDASTLGESDVCSGSYYSKLYSIRTLDGSYIYVALQHSKYASGYGGVSITAYKLKDGNLICQFPCFITSSKSVGYIGFNYDFSLPINRDAEFPEIKFSKDNSLIYVPVIDTDDAVTKKYLTYKFDGYRYVFQNKKKQ